MATSPKQIKVTLLKSPAHRGAAHKGSVRGLGLRRRHHTVLVNDTPQNRGMINAVKHGLEIKLMALHGAHFHELA